jgi:hypothetical protein
MRIIPCTTLTNKHAYYRYNITYNNLIHSGNKYVSKGNHNREHLSFIKEDMKQM